MMPSRWFLAGGALFVLGAVGCKSTEMMMVNDLGEDVVVSLQGPGTIKPDPPAMPLANAGKGVFKIETPNTELPADYQWQAAGRTGTIVVTKDSPKRQVLNLSTGERVSSVAVGAHAKPSVEVKVKP